MSIYLYNEKVKLKKQIDPNIANGIIIPEKKKERNIRGIAIALAVAVFLARSPIIIANKQNGIEYK